jgi:hypothetical protein
MWSRSSPVYLKLCCDSYKDQLIVMRCCSLVCVENCMLNLLVKNCRLIFFSIKKRSGKKNKWLTVSSYIGKYLRISAYIGKPFLIYIWLWNCFTLNYLIYEENLIFFFISALSPFHFPINSILSPHTLTRLLHLANGSLPNI